MAAETFTKGGAATVTFERASQVQQGQSHDIEQNVGLSYGRSKKIDTYNDTAVKFLEVTFVFLTKTGIDNLVTFFNDSNVNWRKNSFTYTDSNGDQSTVRLAQNGINPRRISPRGKFQITLLLEVE